MEHAHLLLGEHSEQPVCGELRSLASRGQLLLPRTREVERVAAPVPLVWPALDEPIVLELIKAQGDFLADKLLDTDGLAANGWDLATDKADAVISDMAASASGHRQTDQLKIMALCDAALDFAKQVLKPGGTFLCKVLRGGTERELLDGMKRDFAMVRHVKPKASRSDSAELFVLASGFRGH